jgi:hypothetical protein
MTNFEQTGLRWAIASFLVIGMVPAASGADLSRYRQFQFGADLATVAKQAGVDASQAKIIHRRPVVMQDLEWRPQPLSSTDQTEPVKEVVFSFYAGELFQVVVNYDRYEIEGLTDEDLVEAVSLRYGVATKPAASKPLAGSYGEQEHVVAQWQNPRYRFDLIRSAYGPDFKLVGVLKQVEDQARAANIEAARLDDIEAPQREADRIAREGATERGKLEKARRLNRPKFRP